MGEEIVVSNLVMNLVARGASSASNSVNRTASSMHGLGKASDTASKHANKLVASLKRIAMYRMLRTVIKDIGKAFSEGLKDAYKFSQTVGGQLAKSLDSIASHGMQMKNQLGSALGELLMNLQPMIEALASLVTRIADAFARLFAVLGGRSTYNKATESAEKWAKETKSGAKAAKEWKNQLLKFDEINKLEEPKDSNSGKGADSIGNWEEAEAQMKWAEELKKITSDWLSTVNFEPIINAWERLKTAVGGFVSLVDQGLKWAYENVLLPLAGWTIEQAAPVVVNLLASAFELLNAILEKLSPVFLRFYEDIIKPFAQWLGENLLNNLSHLTDIFESLTGKVKKAKSFGEFLKSLKGDEVTVFAIATAIGAVVTACMGFRLVTNVIGLAKSAFAMLTSPVGIAITAITALVAIGITLYKNWDKIKETATKLAEGIKSAFSKMESAFSGFIHKVGDPITEFFDRIISKVKEVIDWIYSLFSIFGDPNANAAQAQADGSIYLQGFASGGYPDEGQLFMAGEAGPELVGTIGGRTAVATNSDIVASVSEGVYEAVSSALGSGSFGNQPVNVRVFLDSREIKAGQQRLARATGSA